MSLNCNSNGQYINNVRPLDSSQYNDSYWFKKVYKPYGRKCHSRQTVARKVDLHCVELKPQRNLRLWGVDKLSYIYTITITTWKRQQNLKVTFTQNHQKNLNKLMIRYIIMLLILSLLIVTGLSATLEGTWRITTIAGLSIIPAQVKLTIKNVIYRNTSVSQTFVFSGC